MMYRRPLALTAAGLVALSLALLFAGCSGERARNDLSSPAPGTAEQFYRAQEPAAGASPQALLRTRALNETGTKVEFFNGNDGTVVSLGRCTLTVPPGALAGPQNIRLDVPADGYVEAQLYPEGLTFDTPAVLEMDLTGTTCDGDDATIYWYDPVAGAWVDMHGTYDPKTHKVSAKLPHFSDYRGGRAGW